MTIQTHIDEKVLRYYKVHIALKRDKGHVQNRLLGVIASGVGEACAMVANLHPESIVISINHHGPIDLWANV